MRKIVDADLKGLIGSSICGFRIEKTRRKSSDSDCYGIALGKNDRNVYVTWQFHFNDDLSVYRGHYTENPDVALQDYYNRDIDEGFGKYRVTITEMSRMDVIVEAGCPEEAEQIVSDKWRNGEYVLDSENFCNAEFTAAADGEGFNEG